MWINDRIAAEGLSAAATLELRALLTRLSTSDPNDDRAVAAWNKLKETAPKLWEASKPILQSVIGDVIKKHVGL